MGNWMSGMAADGPMCTVKAYSPPDTGDKILIPVDGSSHAANAVEFYLKKLHKPGVEVVFVHAAQPPRGVSEQSFSDIDAVNEFERSIEESRKTSSALEAKYMEKVKEFGLENYRMVGAEGKPGECIIQAAVMEKPTMIVMGSRGLGPIARTVLGSVSHYVMCHADVPVLIFKTRRSQIHPLKNLGDATAKAVHRFS